MSSSIEHIGSIPAGMTMKRLIYQKLNTPMMSIAIVGMILSYFYNLPVLTYSAIGNNELRLYDFSGAILMYLYFKNIGLVNNYIRSIKIFDALLSFLIWGTICIFFTAIASILANKLLYIMQSILYLFHFWSFFLNAVFVAILIQNKKWMKRIVTLSMIAAVIVFIIVLLQNFRVIPFLWNDGYAQVYSRFLSGTLGPNKIVLGMTSLLMFCLSIGLLNETRVKFNKPLLLSVITLSLIVIIMSGSRTSYVGLAVFLLYFSIKETLNFVYSAIAMIIMLFGVSSFNPEILSKATEVYEDRVEQKMDNPDDLKEANVGNMYKDLGAGRDQILVTYLELLAKDYYYIPFGRGFNNRLETYSSAHNTYLSLVYEVGLLGMILYFRWLVMYLFIRMRNFPKMKMALHGLIISMLITLFFGEHLYIYRPLFGLLGLFLYVTTLLASPIFVLDNED